MAKSQETFNKKEVKNKKEKKRKDKEKKMLERKESGKTSNFEDMIAYVDENGMLTSTPPDASNRKATNAEDIEIGIPKRDDAAIPDKIRRGIVSFYNESKGYGFIKDTETKESVFVHANQLQDAIAEGNAVLFEVEKGQRGPTAVRVKREK